MESLLIRLQKSQNIMFWRDKTKYGVNMVCISRQMLSLVHYIL